MVVIHLLAIASTLFIVLYADLHVLPWFLGKKKTVSKKHIAVTHTLVSIGLALIITSGALMAFSRLESLLVNKIFIVKMVFVSALVVNSFFIGRISKLAEEKSFRDLTAGQRWMVLVSAGVSVLSWLGALVAGFLF